MRAKNIFQVSVRFRILSIGIVATLGFISYLAFNFFVNQANIEDMASIKEKDYPIIERADHIITKLDSVQSHFLSALMEADEDEAETANMLVIKIKKDFKDITGFDGSRQSLESLSKINKLLSSYDGLSTTLIKRVIEDDISMQESSMKSQQINIIYEQLKKSIKDFRNSYYIEANKTIDAVNERASNALVLGIIIGVMMILMVTWIAEYNARLITRNINNVTKFLDKMSNGDGDLTVRITEKGNDELQKLAHAFNRFVDKLQAIITEIGGNSDVLSQASGKCQNYMSHASEEIQTQQLQTDQIATAINQMSASIQEVAQNALLAAEKTEEGHQQTAVGQSEVKGTMEAIDHLAMDLKQAADVITMLGEESDKINSVVTTIRGIAEQTNLLALNAAIEAARAGEQGRGFAVVADEVRALALRSQELSEGYRQSLYKNDILTTSTFQDIQASGKMIHTELLSTQSKVNSCINKIAEFII